MAKPTRREYIKTCKRMSRLNNEKLSEALKKAEKATDEKEKAEYLLEADGWLRWLKIWEDRAKNGGVSDFS